MKPRGYLALTAILALAALAAACAPATDLGLGLGPKDASSGPAEAPVPPPPQGVAPAQAARPAARPAAPLALEQTGGTGVQAQAGQAQVPSVLDRMIIRTADMALSVKDIQFAIQEVERIATLAGGMVFGSSFGRTGGSSQATVTIRVPPDQRTFQQTLEALRAIEGAKVEQQNIRGEDVTEQYTDLEAQIRNLLRTEQRLLALLDRAQRIEDVLVLERELSNVRNQAERLEGRKRLLERRVELATITVTLREEGSGARPPSDFNPLRVAAQALAALVNATQGLVTVLIWLIVWSPIYAGPILLIWALRNRVTRPRQQPQV